MEQKSVKETIELLNGIELLAVAGVKIAKDGKVAVDDLPHLITLATNVSTLVDAATGVEQIPAEVKDLSQAEMIEIVSKVYAVVAKIKEAKA